MAERWRIELLGGLRAIRGEIALTRFRTQKVGVLLAYLAYYPRRPQPREVVIELLWPETEPQTGRDNLRFVLSALRQALEPPGTPPGSILIADRTTVRLNPEAFSTDVAEFQAALAAAARAADAAGRMAHRVTAVERYQGELLPGYYEPWVLTERQRLAELYQGALQELVAAEEQAGELQRAIEYAQRAVSADPLREEAHYDLMRLYAAAGQPSATLQQYRELERLLREELGETPSAATRALAEELRDSARTVVVARAFGISGQAAPRDPSANIPPPFAPPGALATPPDAPPPAGPPASPPSSFPHPPIPSSPPPAAPRLPAQFGRFFGREEEVAALAATMQIGSRRLVTLTGPGGSGKTRLAIAVAGRLQEEFAGAIWFVPLAEVTEAQRVPDAIIAAMELPRSGAVDPLDQLTAALQTVGASASRHGDADVVSEPCPPAPALLVLDNFEQLVEEGAPLLRTLLERVPTLTCLVTSRRRLELEGEQEFVVLPLPVPPITAFGAVPPQTEPPAPNPQHLMQFPSVQLFVDRARAARPEFQVTGENATAVVQLCNRLEGLPLAIELAAARAGVLTPQQTLSRLEQRFELLVSRRRDVSARHRSLRAALEWSYQLLCPELRQFFAQLSIFRGGWTLEAAEAVCGDFGFWILDFGLGPTKSSGCPEPLPAIQNPISKIQNETVLEYLQQLRQASLVVVEELPGGAGMRYRLLETLRDFASTQLTAAAREALAERHAQFFLSLAEQAERESPSAVRKAWVDQLELELDNLRAALDWSLAGDPGEPGRRELGLALAGALGGFWQLRGYFSEGRRYLSALVEEVIPPRPDGEGEGTGTPQEFPRGRHRDRRALLVRMKALGYAGRLSLLQGESGAAPLLLEESLSIARELDDPERVAHALRGVALARQDPQEKRKLFEEALEIYRALGDRQSVARMLVALGMTACQEDPARARAFYEEALTHFRRSRDAGGISWTLVHLGNLVYRCGDCETLRACAEESLTLFRELRERLGICCSYNQLGDVALEEGRPEEAWSLHEEALRLTRELGSQPDIAGTLTCLGNTALARGDAQAAAALYDEAMAIYRTHNWLRDSGWTLVGLGRVAEQQGDAEQAAGRFRESLALGQRERTPLLLVASFEGLARAAAQAGAEGRAARLLGAAASVLEAWGAPLPPRARSESERAAASLRAALGEAAFDAAWRAGHVLPFEQAIAEALAGEG